MWMLFRSLFMRVNSLSTPGIWSISEMMSPIVPTWSVISQKWPGLLSTGWHFMLRIAPVGGGKNCVGTIAVEYRDMLVFPDLGADYAEGVVPFISGLFFSWELV